MTKHFFLFSVVKTTQILSRQSQSMHKKCRSSYCMIKIKKGLLAISVTMQGPEKLVGEETARYREATRLFIGLLFFLFFLRLSP